MGSSRSIRCHSLNRPFVRLCGGLVRGRRLSISIHRAAGRWQYAAAYLAITLACGCAARADRAAYDLPYRIEEYLEMRSLATREVGSLRQGLPARAQNQQVDRLATTIQRFRQGLGQGVILTPGTARSIRQRLEQRLNEPDGPQLWRALADVRPAPFGPVVNERYPATEPRGSMPPPLLEVLPRLPDELSYRFVGRDLLLMDRSTSVILDIVTNALPPPPS